jgi:hypothetical protein
MDVNTWPSAFVRYPSVDDPVRGTDALGFIRRTMVTRSDDGSVCGFDGMGPLSVWNEGTAQFVAAGGPDAAYFSGQLLAQQHPDGSMPASPDNWSSPFGWLSTWSGLAPTSWLYFALTGRPFLDAPVYEASSAVQAAENAFDGNPATRWESALSDPQWLAVDHGTQRWVNRVTLKWETAHARSYNVQVSTDGARWTDVFTTAAGDGGTDIVEFPAVQARYVRMYGTERGTPWAYSLWEMSADYVAAPAAPVINPIPLSNTGDYAVSWGPVDGAGIYELQESLTTDFSSLSGGGWPSGPSEPISGRRSGTYFYRVRAWTAAPENGGAAGEWSEVAMAQVTLN